MQQVIYTKDNKFYKIVDWCKIQSTQSIDGYIYMEADKTYHVAKHKFVMSIEEFHKTFKPVSLEFDWMKNDDSSSLLEMIRSEQLYTILGKYKIF